MKAKLLKKLNHVSFLSNTSKLRRLLNNPYKYIFAILFRKYIYPKSKKPKSVIAKTFFDINMNILLPSSTDIYITQGKSHSSEIRLASFIIKTLEEKDTFIDVGAHYGYFTLLAKKIIGKKGKIYSFEASKKTYEILKLNCDSSFNIYNKAISDCEGFLSFYEFPNLYSEYNSFNIEQFKNSSWFEKNKPRETKIETIPLSKFIEQHQLEPKIIKIDVEGAEFKVIKGLENFINNNDTIIVMEFLSNKRDNEEHIKAQKLLFKYNYLPFAILDTGKLLEIDNLVKHFEDNDLDSDNIVFMRS